MPSKVDKVPINEESEPDQKERRRLAELELNSIKKSLPKLEGDQLRLAKIEIRLLSKWLDHL